MARNKEEAEISRRMPGEWEPHRATWIGWPHEESDWPEKLAAVEWVFAELVRLIAEDEMVEILCDNVDVRARAEHFIAKHHVRRESYRLHLVANDRNWLRDSAPTLVYRNGVQPQKEWIAWQFNAWARYENFGADAVIARSISEVSGIPLVASVRPDASGKDLQPLVLEGGAIDTDGRGTLLVTEECLLSEVQARNPGLTKQAYERAFKEYLGIEKTIWLRGSVEGDDTHGHIDDVARFVSPGKVVLAFEDDPADSNHKTARENLERLKSAKDASGRSLEVSLLPMPRNISCGHERLPASYANFYVTNGSVVVPTFNDMNDRTALGLLSDLFPGRKVVGLHSVDLILGQGSIHCLTQQEPA